MDFVRVAVGILLIAIGILSNVNPMLGFRVRTYIARKLFGMRIEPGPRTLRIYRISGGAFVIIGVLLLTTA